MKGILFFNALFIFLLCQQFRAYAQVDEYEQFSPSIELNRAFSQKWAAQIDLAATFSETNNDKNFLSNIIQHSYRIWLHQYYSPRWKLSGFVAYYDNKDAPEIGQYKSKEFRFAFQGIYYFHKLNYTLNSRTRFELRYLENEDYVYYDIERYRQQIRFIKPINRKVLEKGVFYFISAEEVFLRTTTSSKALEYFDRNKFTIGFGYLLSDDMQIEVAYVNEYLPRTKVDQIYHCAAVTFTFNNLIDHLREKTNHLLFE